MKPCIYVLMVALASAVAAAQTPQTAPAPDAAQVAPDAAAPSVGPPGLETFQSDDGVLYQYPSDWEVLDSKPMTPVAQLKAEESASSQTEKSAAHCVDIPLVIRHGTPKSVIMIEVLPFACAHLNVKPSDLAGVASGMAKGLQKGFHISDPRYGAYRLGTHDFSLERAQGTGKDHPELKATIEVACSILKKSLVCWMAIARDDEALRVFEQGKAALEGDGAAPLVPAGALKHITQIFPKAR